MDTELNQYVGIDPSWVNQMKSVRMSTLDEANELVERDLGHALNIMSSLYYEYDSTPEDRREFF